MCIFLFGRENELHVHQFPKKWRLPTRDPRTIPCDPAAGRGNMWHHLVGAKEDLRTDK
jgi:hypothetical protein